MSIVNFSIPSTLDRRVTQLRKQKGFASKAEFFRFAAIYFMDVIERPIASEEERFNYLTDGLIKEISGRYRGKELPAVRKQLKDLGV